MAVYKPVTHVIFDLDGTLLNTEHVFTGMYQSIAERFDKMVTWKVRSQCMGRQPEDTAALLIRELHLPLTVQEMLDIEMNDFYHMAREGFLNCELMPGAERLVKHLHANKIPIAIATSSKKETFNLKITNHSDVFRMFHHTVCRDDPEVKRTKPAPDIFQVCCSRFPDNPPTENVLVVEDSPNGVQAAVAAEMQAAVAAEMQVLMVPDSRVDVSLRENATLVINTLEEFKPEIFGLPSFCG